MPIAPCVGNLLSGFCMVPMLWDAWGFWNILNSAFPHTHDPEGAPHHVKKLVSSIHQISTLGYSKYETPQKLRIEKGCRGSPFVLVYRGA